MARRSTARGKISTYFSYKGGVGRTMAVANVGFLAALAGKRVLLMDWDLEAPGLAVYFRGVTEHKAALDIRKSDGVLDLFIEWRDKLLDAQTSTEVSTLFDRFVSGKPFAACACPLVPAARLPKGAKLDLIGAGGKIVGEREPLPYAEALSRFHWPTFFADFAGGAMLDAFRGWAKKNYDLILIDSRTGLADVAGICTMQLPDEVVLCFVLNRQNTEGVADIAASIRAARGDEVRIRLSPMRVSKDRPTEEADARARAQRELRNAGLSPESVESDMASLSIAAAPNVPFYETLAPFVATSTSADPLTFEYLRMTQEMIGTKFEVPKLEQGWVETVRRRLQPRMTTVEYLSGLESADPDRAYEELDRFLDGALDADPNRELDADYVDALVRTAFEAGDWLWGENKQYPLRTLAEKALLLVRQLNTMGDGDWRIALVDALDEFDLRWSPSGGRETLKRTLDRDKILADGQQSNEILLRRARLAVYMARLREPETDRAQAEADLDRAQSLLNIISRPLTDDESDRLAIGFGEISAQRARICQRLGEVEQAKSFWLQVIELLPNARHMSQRGVRARNLVAEAHMSLASSADPAEASDHVIAAVRLSRTVVTRDVDQLARAVGHILAGPDSPEQALAFADLTFGRGRARGSPPLRAFDVAQSTRLAHLLEQLVLVMGEGPRRGSALLGLTDAAEQQLHRATRFISIARAAGPDPLRQMLAAYFSLCDTLSSAGAPESALEAIKLRLEAIRRTPRRPRS
ncbi:MAG TPA: hypothetical protein DEP91_01220 [Sphingomonas bacterium]|jgi:MinD-like ATPase involved in chromosome partitioning or flagellar assembly/tetratricopeptide (TPR) repeat protein|uniref:CobQ/CobB/MinD/ParA nucleotide binding domain-containing protein n=1 Tax=Sphingomonas bacterium TaxID=1895847 RepID=A0A3D0W7S5_9SPHN|nr:hypothetical protein [Sphingomonas bacterium]